MASATASTENNSASLDPIETISTDSASFETNSTSLTRWPSTIKKFIIVPCSSFSRELTPILLTTIQEQLGIGSDKIRVKNSYSPDPKNTILYILICPAGLDIWTPGKKLILPKYYINWQLEFYNGNKKASRFFSKPEYRRILSEALMNWDYSEYNIKNIKKDFNMDFAFVPIGHHETMSRTNLLYGKDGYPKDADTEYDILFLGWIDAHPRRKELHIKMHSAGLKTCFRNDLDPEGMKKEIKKAKICINFHADHKFILETIRLNVLLSNQTCIVSEWALDDDVCREYADGGVTFCLYDEILTVCQSLLADYEKRKNLAENSYWWYRREMKFVDINDFSGGSLLPILN